MASDNRPVYLNLVKIKLPVTGMISIFHRLTGVLLFIFIPFSLYYLQLSISNEKNFEQISWLMLSPVSRFLILLMTWSLVHHLLTGIRFLIIDLEFFLEKEQARSSAWVVVLIEAIIMALIIAVYFL